MTTDPTHLDKIREPFTANAIDVACGPDTFAQQLAAREAVINIEIVRSDVYQILNP
jgi:hypothetical protein